MPDLSVVTLNLHGGVRTRRISMPRLRSQPRSGASSNGAYDVAGVLRSFDADVVVVQEAWWPDDHTGAVDAVAREQGASVHAVTFGRGIIDPWPHIMRPRRGDGTGRLGIAVLSRVPSRVVGELAVGDVPADPARRRCALHVSFDVEGQPLELIVVHLSSRLPYGPPFQIRRLRPQLPPPGRRAALVGDFNLWGPPVTAMRPGWRRAVTGRTWPAHRPHSQIDHVFVRDDVEVVDAEVLDEVGSDHRPVRVRMRW